MKKCPLCEKDSGQKVIACGLPMILCVDESCNCLWGEPWATIYIVVFSPLEGMFSDEFCFFAYEGSYLKALWHWMGL